MELLTPPFRQGDMLLYKGKEWVDIPNCLLPKFCHQILRN